MIVDFLERELVVGNRVVYTRGTYSALYKGVITRLTPKRAIVHDVGTDWQPLLNIHNPNWNSHIVDPLQIVKLGR